MNELELRYGDCTVKRLSGGTLNGAIRNLERYHYAGTPLGVIRVTGRFGEEIGRIEKTLDTDCWCFKTDGIPYPPRCSAAELMRDIKAEYAIENETAND